MNRPRALLLDEPLGALDLRLRKQLQIELKRIQQDVGITFVHVTHDQEEAMSMADMIAVMNGGKIEQAGSRPTSTTARAPRSWRTSSAISNLIERRWSDDASTSRPTTARQFHAPGLRRAPTGEVRDRRAAGEDHVAPAGEPVPDGSNVVKGKIVVAAFLGVSIQYVIKAAGGEELTVFAQNTADAEPDGLAVGREVQLVWQPEHTFVVERG